MEPGPCPYPAASAARSAADCIVVNVWLAGNHLVSPEEASLVEHTDIGRESTRGRQAGVADGSLSRRVEEPAEIAV